MAEWQPTASNTLRQAMVLPGGPGVVLYCSREVREHHKNVNLPQSLQRVFGIPLTVDQLDSAVFERFSNDVVLQPPPREFRDLLYKMPVLATQVVVPAGIPLRWIEDLPITGRTRAAVQQSV